MLTIVWDIDDVLNDLTAAWFKNWWLPGHSDCRLAYEDLVENPPHQVLGIAKEDYLASIDEFRGLHEPDLSPNVEILDWMHEEGRNYRHFVLTARPVGFVPGQAHWVFRHFRGFVCGYGIVPSRPLEVQALYPSTKAEYLLWMGVGDIFVDDNKANITAVQKLGLAAILYPQPWNGSTKSTRQVIDAIERAAVSLKNGTAASENS